jgi:hypothetical protein
VDGHQDLPAGGHEQASRASTAGDRIRKALRREPDASRLRGGHPWIPGSWWVLRSAISVWPHFRDRQYGSRDSGDHDGADRVPHDSESEQDPATAAAGGHRGAGGGER